MRTIQKQREPEELIAIRKQPGAAFDDLQGSDKPGIRENLVTEQRGLCAFCCARITDDPFAMKIAHWHPQNAPGGGEVSLDYENILGACLGGEGRPRNEQHCDTHQGNMLLARNPANPQHNVEHFVSFDVITGEIRSSDVVFNEQLGAYDGRTNKYRRGVLNLNMAWMRKNRVGVLAGFQMSLDRRPLTRAQVNKHIAAWDGSQAGALPPYAPVVVYWLRKNLPGCSRISIVRQ